MENLNELLGRFMDAGQAENAAEDIRAADIIFAKNHAPGPDQALVAKIKTLVSDTLEIHRSIAFRRRIYRVAAVAAAFIIVSALSVRIFQPPVHRQGPDAYAAIIPAAVWEGDDIVADDAELATISAAIDQIQGEMLALQDGEDGLEAYDELLDLESELIEIESDFWKG